MLLPSPDFAKEESYRGLKSIRASARGVEMARRVRCATPVAVRSTLRQALQASRFLLIRASFGRMTRAKDQGLPTDSENRRYRSRLHQDSVVVVESEGTKDTDLLPRTQSRINIVARHAEGGEVAERR